MKKMKEDNKLFNIVNPDTKKRYEIPMLNKNDHNYRELYIVAMRLKQEDPESFERMMDWK